MNDPNVIPPPLTSRDDTLWIVLSHLSVLLGFGILIPLIVYLAKRDDSAAISHHSKEALNFHISLYIYAIACIPLCFFLIGIPLLFALGVAAFILSIVAAVRGADGQEYRYPLTIRFI